MTRESKHIAIATVAFVDEKTLEVGKGGLQRWCRDIADLAVAKGWRVTVYQKSNLPIEAVVKEGLRIQGIPAPARFWGNYVYGRAFSKRVAKSIPVIYASQELMLGMPSPRCVAINHGIWWDGDFVQWKRWVNKLVQQFTVERARGVICVDTNYINWCHAELPRRSEWRHKLRYVPNYADERVFGDGVKPTNVNPHRPIRILYPRRLMGRDLETDGRGAGLFLEALAELHRRGVHFEVEFAGPGPLRNQIQRFAAQSGFAHRVFIAEYTLDDMPSAYRAADIVAIPSTAHEGTSLAAVEAMTAGKPTVVTHIGGLPNLIIEGINGFICDLSVESLCRALLAAAERRDDRAWSSQLATSTARAFGKARWERAIWSQLEGLLELK